MPSVIMLNVTYKPYMLNVFMLIVVMLNVVMLSVVGRYTMADLGILKRIVSNMHLNHRHKRIDRLLIGTAHGPP
jgi:hypothetical protein